VDYKAMLVRDYIGALTAMYDRKALGTRLMPEMLKRQDYALWLSIMRDGHDARGLAEPLAVYRAQQAGSLSSNKLSLVSYNWALYREHEGLSVPRATRALAGAVVQSLRNSRISLRNLPDLGRQRVQGRQAAVPGFPVRDGGPDRRPPTSRPATTPLRPGVQFRPRDLALVP
jgi:hypothetical protein